MAEIAKINKVNIYRESLGDNQINYELVQKNVPIGTDINIEPNMNSGSFLLKGADTTDGSIQFGATNGITATAEGGLIANSITANHLTASKISGNAGGLLSFQNISCQGMSAGNFMGGTANIGLITGEKLEMTNVNADIIDAGRLKSGGILFSDNAVQVGNSSTAEGAFAHTWHDETTGDYGVLLFKELHSSTGVIGHDNCDGHQRCLIYIVCKRGDTIIGTDFLIEIFDYLDNQPIGKRNPLMITNSNNEKYLRGCGLPFKQLYSFYSKEGDNIYFNLAASNGNTTAGNYIQAGDRYHTSIVYYN